MRALKIQLFVILALFLFTNASCQVSDTNAISNEQFKTIAAKKGVVILDVRTAAEFNEGHIPHATNIDVLQTDAFKTYIASLPKDKTYLLYCRSGKRSSTALSLMRENGFVDVKHLQKGFAGWDGSVEKP